MPGEDKRMPSRILYTIGHSTHSMAEFLDMLATFDIRLLADVRTLPGSRRFPHFDRENLEKVLPAGGIAYRYMKELGGLRKARKDSRNTIWRNASFRGYADYMETDEYRKAVEDLQKMAAAQPTAIMCAEAVWWRCHRSMIADTFKADGWKVLHIMTAGKAEEHPYTRPAKIIEGKVVYGEKPVA